VTRWEETKGNILGLARVRLSILTRSDRRGCYVDLCSVPLLDRLDRVLLIFWNCPEVISTCLGHALLISNWAGGLGIIVGSDGDVVDAV